MNLLSFLVSQRNKTTVSSFEANLLIDACLIEAQKSFQAKDYQQALLYCEQALDQDPTNGHAFRLRGVIRYELDDLLGASQDLKWACKLLE